MSRRPLMILLLAAGCFWSAGVARAATVEEDFATANQLYEDRKYDEALALYEKTLARGEESASLYYNLGNAYFKSGDLGHAMLYYLRAERLAPGDDDLRHNIEFARQYSQVQMEGVDLNPVSDFLSSLVAPYRLSTLAWTSSALFILTCLILMLRWGLGLITMPLRVATPVVVVLLLGASGLTTYKYRDDYLIRRAVLLAEDTPVLNGPAEKAELEFTGAPGLVVRILSESADYYNVLFENKRRGWIQKDLVAEV